MPKFFIKQQVDNFFEIGGENARHIIKSLRMKVKDQLILCYNEIDYICDIIDIKSKLNLVTVKCTETKKCTSEPKTKVTLYQSLPKSDKMDFIVQKAVEVGVTKIVPVLTERCVSRPDSQASLKKAQRWQKIATEAAMQSGRGIIPEVAPPMSFSEAIKDASKCDQLLVFYEKGKTHFNKILKIDTKSIAIFIGPEGGFEDNEISIISAHGGQICTLGPRILRTETAAIVGTSLIIHEFDLIKGD